MGSSTILQMFENPRRGRQARTFTTNVPKILDLKSSSEETFSKNCRCMPLLLKLGDHHQCKAQQTTNRRGLCDMYTCSTDYSVNDSIQKAALLT